MKKSIVLCILLILLLLRPDCTTEGARYGLLLWYNSVVPALFPFMVLSNLIVHTGGITALMTPVYKILHPFFPVSPAGCYVLVTGILCGCPMGAKTCSDFVSEGAISREEAKFLLAICSHPSPMFILGYVYPFFAEHIASWQLLLCVYLPVIVLAFAAKFIYHAPHTSTVHTVETRPVVNAMPIDAADTIPTGTANAVETQAPALSADESILAALEILCKIGGYLMLFSILILFIRNTAWIPDPIRLVLIGSMEMTTAIRELTASMDFSHAFPASMAALNFCGFSGLFQVRSVLNEKKTGLSVRPCFFWKLTHAALSAACAIILCIMRFRFHLLSL